MRGIACLRPLVLDAPVSGSNADATRAMLPFATGMLQVLLAKLSFHSCDAGTYAVHAELHGRRAHRRGG
eukprot:2533712-Rhodomonas_salina.5